MAAIDDFVSLSVVLTGFSQSIIAPALDPVDIKTVYFDKWTQEIGVEAVNAILQQFDALKTASPNLGNQALGEKLLTALEEDAVMACRQLIYLWYMGAWPTIIGEGETAMTSFETLSPASYAAGLVWQVMQAHPMGDSRNTYGYWHTPPAPLKDFTGESTGNGGNWPDQDIPQ